MIFFWLSLLLLLLFAGRYVLQAPQRRAGHQLQQLASSVAMAYRPGRWGEEPRLESSLGGSWLQFSVYRETYFGHRATVELIGNWPTTNLVIEADPNTLRLRLVDPLGTQGARQASATVRAILNGMALIPGFSNPAVETTGGLFRCRARLDRVEGGRLQPWLASAIHVYHDLRAESEPGIHYLEDRGECEETPAICLVCGATIPAHLMRSCARCGTPHHHECWEYNHGCAVYGCYGTVMVAPLLPGQS